MIKEAELSNIPDIVECFKNCKLTDNYFNEPDIIKDFLTDSINKRELYIYTNNNEIQAFIRVDPIGMLSKFPLLRTLIVKQEYRSKGIGRELLYYYEKINSMNNGKIFLCVSDFNKRAKKLYTEIGYEEVGYIKNLYKHGINEYIMCKTITKDK